MSAPGTVHDMHASGKVRATTSLHSLVDISPEECLGLLSAHHVGRLCVIDDAYPIALPVNYRVAPDGSGGAAIVVRTRAGSLLDRDAVRVGFEIDGIDHLTETGWSVLVRGLLHHAESAEAVPSMQNWDPRSWAGPLDTWLVLTPDSITGRRLESSVSEWAFAIEGYL